jgi:hypothetical protein
MVVEDRIAPLPYFGRVQTEVQQVDLTPPLLERVCESEREWQRGEGRDADMGEGHAKNSD